VPRILLIFGKVINRLFGYSKAKSKYFQSWKYLHTISLQGMGRKQGSAVEISGEENALKNVIQSAEDQIVIMDVGANKGDYTSMICKQPSFQKNIAIHLFEPSLFNKDVLQKKFNATNFQKHTFFVNQLALSDENGSSFLYTDSEGSDLASLINLNTSVRKFDDSKKERVQTITLDEYCKSHNVNSIDLLKIDVEGAEYKVLKGAHELLEKNQIKNIQFEFGTGNITSRIFFCDFWNLLSAKYNFFQIMSDGLIPIRKYSIDMEIFQTTNFFLTLK